ncbi:MAG: response regulator [Jatrophihabitans sp.]|uniref:response regulator n=1 Tax=Jatrophihabitans sp. TaxID=1932789 RepID=UPI0039147ACF
MVEDNERGLKLVTTLLELRGYEVLPAGSAQDGIDQAARHAPALIVMDIQLPDMLGVEALRVLRADPVTRSIPVVALTALAMKGDRERLLASGFDGYLSKPLDVATFVDSLEAVMTTGTGT